MQSPVSVFLTDKSSIRITTIRGRGTRRRVDRGELKDLDLVVAVSIGFLTLPTWAGVLGGIGTSEALASLPLSMIPTFAVPIYFIFHLITLRRLRKWPAHR